MWMNHRGMILVSQAPTLVGKPHINLLLPGPTGMQKATSMKNGGVLPLAACRDRRSSASCQYVLIHLALLPEGMGMRAYHFVSRCALHRARRHEPEVATFHRILEPVYARLLYLHIHWIAAFLIMLNCEAMNFLNQRFN
jgi:hypothetical protein